MLTIKKSLVPTDFSNVSVPAIGYAISLAKDHNAEVSLLHALPTEEMKEHFSESYVAGGLVSPAEGPIGVTGVTRAAHGGESFHGQIRKREEGTT